MATKEQQTKELQLVEFLETFLPAINSRVPTIIDHGGCGIFAKILYENIKKTGIETKIKFIASPKQKKAIENIIEKNKYEGADKHIGFLHCAVALNDYIYFDNDGVTKPLQVIEKALNKNGKKEEAYIGEISAESLQVFIDNVESWNDIFDRDCIPQITEELSKLPEEFAKFIKNGTIDFEAKDHLKYTEKTIEGIKFARMMGAM